MATEEFQCDYVNSRTHAPNFVNDMSQLIRPTLITISRLPAVTDGMRNVCRSGTTAMGSERLNMTELNGKCFLDMLYFM